MRSIGARERAQVASLPLFAECSAVELDRLLATLDVVDAAAGSDVVVEGSPSDHAYVMLAGEADVLRRGATVATLGPGELFGETAIVSGGVRTATVRMTSAGRLARLDVASVATLPGTATITRAVLEALLERIRGDEAADAAVAAARRRAPAVEGEVIAMLERVVVAPTVGIFRRDHPTETGSAIAAGASLGSVESLGSRKAVTSPFSGLLMELLALDGEHVQVGQPVAWLRTF